MSDVVKITEKKDLVAGILYCLFTYEYDTQDIQHERDGALVYWSGDRFLDEEGDTRYDDWDFAVAQSTVPDRNYVDQPWVSL